ncbi:hypothetical protein TNCV_292151 [Trichonephila clavipes]|nr:hypothetical protein TNCV_292151 [Trichonephila clavipes]
MSQTCSVVKIWEDCSRGSSAHLAEYFGKGISLPHSKGSVTGHSILFHVSLDHHSTRSNFAHPVHCDCCDRMSHRVSFVVAQSSSCYSVAFCFCGL